MEVKMAEQMSLNTGNQLPFHKAANSVYDSSSKMFQENPKIFYARSFKRDALRENKQLSDKHSVQEISQRVISSDILKQNNIN